MTRNLEMLQRFGRISAATIRHAACLVALAAWSAQPAVASTAYGDLNNFDVFNDTGQDCHGFEIELEDVHSTDITYTYDWNHYGPPTITEDNSNPAHPRVLIRYAAKYTAGFSAFTAVPSSAPSPTNGHMCTDPTVNFGCEHFGVGYYGTPTAVRYHWLIEDSFAPGTLIRGPAVNVATPAWTYYPPNANQPIAQVQAAILAPPPPPAPVYEFGDAVWVKAIVTTSHNNARVELADLVSDDPDDPDDENWTNGEPDEVEVEWHLLQTEFSNPDGANNELAGGVDELPDGDEVVTRRYEFYKYTGPLDPESNEAKCDNYPQIADPADPEFKAECDPAVANVLGDYIGAQMAGFNVEAVLGLIDHLPEGEIGVPYTPRTVVVGGNTPYITTISGGLLPAGVSIDSATGVMSGTPSEDGQFAFTVTAMDADLVEVTKAYTMTVAGPVDACAGVVCLPADACHEAGVCDPTTGLCTDPAAPDGTACDDGDACTQSDSCLAGACTGSNPVTCTPSDACHTAGTCDSATGLCSDPAAPDGTACDDGNACTQVDSCAAGACTGSNPVTCTASDACHAAGTCDPASGLCSNPTAPDGTVCNDGDACTLGDTCSAGVCVSGSPDPACGAADLAIRFRAAAHGGVVGKSVVLTARVRNFGPSAAIAASVEITCSGAAHHVGEVAPECVTTGNSTICSVGNVPPKSAVKSSIMIVPDAVGVLECTARALSATMDPNPTNQAVTVAAVIRR